MKKKIIAFALTCAFLITLSAAVMPMAEAAYTDGGGVNTRTTISAGVEHSVAICDEGILWAWGNNRFGQLGDGTTTRRHAPVRIMDDVLSVSAGDFHTIALRNDGSVWSWGLNGVAGRLGCGATIRRNEPRRIKDNVVAIAAGGNHNAAITADGVLWTWGENVNGALGDGTTINRLSPVRIIDDVKYVSVGSGATMAVRSDGSLWTWGDNRWAQLGDGTTTRRLSPVRIMENIVSVSAGGGDITGAGIIQASVNPGRAMAVDSDGVLWGWGENTFGQLGDGTIIHRLTPHKIMDDVISVSTGANSAMAIRSDGSLWGWGRNPLGHGALGDGTTTHRRTPMMIMENVAAVAAGEFHTIAVGSDGVLWTWGDNSFGRLGNNSTSHALSPIRIRDGFALPGDRLASVSDWAVSYVSRAIGLGLVPLRLQSSYTQAITRAEFAALATALYESVFGEIQGRVSFSDTNDVNVEKMAYLGVLLGVGRDRFAPNDRLTREQAAVILARLANVMGNPLPGQTPTFADNASISNWALESVGQLQRSGIMTGVTGNRFAPQGQYTREQSIVTILRLSDLLS